jgi:hypothetical protein
MSVLGVLPEVHDQWLALLHETWRVTDPHLLEQSIAHIAAAYGRPGATTSIAASDERGRAAADYVEQYLVDQNGITATEREMLTGHLAPWSLRDFTFAIWAHDADARVRVLLQIDAGADERAASPNVPLADGRLPAIKDEVADPAFGARIGSFINTVLCQQRLDAETAELARLRNALHQHCLL